MGVNRVCENVKVRVGGQLFYESGEWEIGEFSSSDKGEINEGRVASDGGHAEEARVRASFLENVNVEFPRWILCYRWYQWVTPLNPAFSQLVKMASDEEVDENYAGKLFRRGAAYSAGKLARTQDARFLYDGCHVNWSRALFCHHFTKTIFLKTIFILL